MSKFNKKSKALKAVMAGTVAFTPVIAVGLTGEKASAATIQDTAAKLANDYFSLEAKKQYIVNEVMKVLNSQEKMGYFVEENAFNDATKRKTLVNELTKLVKPFAATTEEGLKNELTSRFTEFTQNTQPILADRGKVQDLLDYINSVTSNLINSANSIDVSTTPINLNPFYGDIRAALFSPTNIPESMRTLLAEPTPTEATTIISEIEKAINGNDSTPPPTPIPTPPTPTPENPVVDDKKGQVTALAEAVSLNPLSVIDVIKSAEQLNILAVAVKEGADSIEIPYSIISELSNKNADSIIAVSSELATYYLPVSEIHAADAAKQLGIAMADLQLVVSMKKVTTPLTSQSTYKVLSDAVDFNASLQAPDGKSVELTIFTKPVQRTITTQATLDPLTTLGVMVDANGNIHPVPTYVKTDKKNTDLYRAGNSTYALIQNFKTFNDVDNGKNWAEDYIEKLASKMVVNGTTATTFDPNRSISRGEFAALLSRGLGLTAQNKNVSFSDVSSGQAFNKNGEIASVVEAGIVKGDKNGKFRPYDTITRDEAAIMISRAMDFIDSEFVKFEGGKKVSHFTDYRYIGSTARPHIEKVYQAGYLGGFSNGTFGPAKETERAQMAKILYNFLQSIHYIN